MVPAHGNFIWGMAVVLATIFLEDLGELWE